MTYYIIMIMTGATFIGRNGPREIYIGIFIVNKTYMNVL